MTTTIFMIHGMWCGPWCWDNYRRVLADRGYRCLAPPLRYHDADPGAPPDPRLGTTTLQDYAADLEAEIRRLEAPPIIIGHSLGGLLAQILVARGLAQAAVLLTPAAPAGILALAPSVLKSFLSMLTIWGFWRKPIRPRLEEVVYSAYHLLPPAEQEATYARLVFESGRVASQIGFWFLDPTRGATVDEKKVTCPLLVVAGRLDRLTPAKVVRRVAAKYRPHATYREFADHGHWLLAEPGWRVVADQVADWLDTVVAAAPAK